MKKVICATYEGVDAKIVDVESSLTKGLPSFSIVGMVNTSISEAKERVKSALLCLGYSLPPKRITINLAPSDLKKDGSQFDLSMALLIVLDRLEDDLSHWAVFGELGLDGSVKENAQLYPLILSLANQNIIKKVIVPLSSLDKLSKIPDIELYGVKTLKDAVELLESKEQIDASLKTDGIEYPYFEFDNKKYYFTKEYKEDFIDVKGQEIAKRAALISACGFHNIIYEGSPGCGKNMIANRMRYIMPAVDMKEVLNIAKLQALELEQPDFKPHRLMRSPHHTSTRASIFGGGSGMAKIGEIGLANGGILFFDELPHFQKPILEALREPMQDKEILISRVNSKIKYETDFLFIGAMNPCPCGNLLDEYKECRCGEIEINRYKNKLSDPFLDRIDMQVVMQNVDVDDKSSYSSLEMHKMILKAQLFAKKRYQTSLNANLNDSDVDKFCLLDDSSNDILNSAISRFSLNFRTIKKIKKVSRTIADLDTSRYIKKTHILEALSYRKR